MLNLPNSITLARLFLVVIFTIVLAFDDKGAVGSTAQLLAFWAFTIGSVSDYIDGYLARKLNLVTNFGKLMDPLADKILVCAAFIYLSTVGVCPFWVTIVIMFREFLVTGLRQLAIDKNIVIAADIYGKWKTVFQLLYCGLALLQLAYASSANGFFSFFARSEWSMWMASILLWASVALTLISGANYCYKARNLVRES